MIDLHLEDQVFETNYDNGWTETTQDKFEEYLVKCNEKAHLHGKAAAYFSKWYRWTTYPVLVMGGVNTVIASLNVRDGSERMSYVIAVLSGVHATAQAFSSFVEFGKRCEGHLRSANGYSALARNIESQLWLQPSERDTPKFNFEVVSREFQTIASTEPFIPEHIK